MKAFIDNRVVRTIASWNSEQKKTVFLEACCNAKLLKDPEEMQLMFQWPSLLEYLDCGSLFEKFPKFDTNNKLFNFIVSAVEKPEKDFLILLYDHLFAECLTEIKAMSQINPAFLTDQIQKKQQSNAEIHDLFDLSLNAYKKSLIENPSHTMHDLILYLAWDRVCVHFGIIFELVFSGQDPLKGLEILKECLLESFQHIADQGRTRPGFFRLVEALYAYQLREENLQTHTDEEWMILCQSSSVLRSREELSDVCYVDAAIVHHQKPQSEVIKVFTMDSVEKVRAGFLLANHMIKKLPDWHYMLGSVEVICLKESDAQLLVDTVTIDLFRNWALQIFK